MKKILIGIIFIATPLTQAMITPGNNEESSSMTGEEFALQFYALENKKKDLENNRVQLWDTFSATTKDFAHLKAGIGAYYLNSNTHTPEECNRFYNPIALNIFCKNGHLTLQQRYEILDIINSKASGNEFIRHLFATTAHLLSRQGKIHATIAEMHIIQKPSLYLGYAMDRAKKQLEDAKWQFTTNSSNIYWREFLIGELHNYGAEENRKAYFSFLKKLQIKYDLGELKFPHQTCSHGAEESKKAYPYLAHPAEIAE